MAKSKNSNNFRVARDYAVRKLELAESCDLKGYNESDLERLKEEFDAAQVQLLATLATEEQQKEWEITVQFEAKFRILREKLEGNKVPQSNIDVSRSSRVKLPKININSFDGNFENWVSFIELYNSLIHSNSNLSEVEKMHYLFSSVRGRALDLIKNIPIASDNYLSAYNALQKEYNKPRQLANAYYENLLNCAPMQKRCGAELKRVSQTFLENLAILKKYNLPDSNFMLFHLLWSKIDKATREAFEVEHRSSEIPLLSALQEFLDRHAQAMEWTTPKVPEASQSRRQTIANRSTLVASTSSCPACSAGHRVNECRDFQDMTVAARFRFAKDKGLCLNCLSVGHRVNQCKVKSRCKTCHQRHNTMLHFEKVVTPEPKPPSVEQVEKIALTASTTSACTLFATARVQVRASSGGVRTLRALLDSASACNFISAKCARALGWPIARKSNEISGIGHTTTKPLGTVNIKMQVAPCQTGVELPFEALVLPSICSPQPGRNIDSSTWDHIRSLRLADPDFSRPGEIDLLLGSDIFASILLPGVIRGAPGQPTAICTKIGWVIMGRDNGQNSAPLEKPVGNRHCLVAFDASLNESLKRFWEIEKVGPIVDKPLLSKKEQQCEEHFASNYSHTDDGRFVVPLPFVDPENRPIFRNSREIALKRFYSLERKLSLNPELRTSYVEFMTEYRTLGHMEEAPPPKTNVGRYYYIPHHGILRPESVSTPLRVVFDAGARDANSKSLNDTLLVGPKLQVNIFDLLIRFRWHPVVFTADICKMYRQILVPQEDAEYQRILWRPSPDVPLQDFRLKTVTYGVSSAPFQALRTIAKLAEESRLAFPEASTVLNRDVYVDDIVTGATSVTQAKFLRDKLIQVLGSAGFRLKKWTSSHDDFLPEIPLEDRYSTGTKQFDESSVVSLKILGLLWIPSEDQFTFRIRNEDRKYTKRTILSDIARIFDPLGLLCPLTFFAKYLIQMLWTSGVSWDDEVPGFIADEWAKFRGQLSVLTAVNLPRRMVEPFIRLQVHGFCDASERGYCAVIYCRSTIAPHEHAVKLACAKSRVAPLRVLSIPRLELEAAVLLSGLMQSFVESLEPLYQIQEIFAWSDSKVALAWIRSCPSKWKTFIANRVSSIQEIIPPECWRHVCGLDNPADVGSRGAFPEDLAKNKLWWNGPSWLSTPEEEWPQSEPLLENELTVVQEERKVLSLVVETEKNAIDDLLKKYSTLTKVVNIVSYCLRFKDNCRSRLATESNHRRLQPSEVDRSLKVIIHHVQRQSFPAEIEYLEKGTPDRLRREFRKLSPFLDERGFVRVGGRLNHSRLSYDAKHPYLLPRNHVFTTLLVRQYHDKFLHPGAQTLHNLLSERFWIVSAKRVVRSITRQCIRCFRVCPARANPPIMGNLPKFRIDQIKPFSIVAIDYGGPFSLALGRGRGQKTFKAYVCVFVCTATKAIHLELASELSTEAFLAALRRFVARRGKCHKIISDQGRNFIGASNQLNTLLENAAISEVIEFVFNPPGSPHFNGLAEAGIKSVKTHLTRVIGTQRLTFEEFYTVLVQIEAILNSRPLTPCSNDPNDLTALTPNHFLTLSSPAKVPEENLLDVRVGILNRWKLIQRFHQSFWDRWHREYLHTLQQRSKWTKSHPNIAIGTMVLLVDERVIPLNWPLGRIVAVHPGQDGVVRVVTVKTANGEYRRSVGKVCPLPVSKED